MSVTVLIAMEKRMPRDYWSRVLSEAGHNPVSCWTTVNDVLLHVREDKPDFLLTEPGFGGNNGFETVRCAVVIHPTLRTVVMLPADPANYRPALQTIINGYLPEESDDPEELLRCIEQIGQGYRYISEVFWPVVGLATDKNTQLIAGLSDRRKALLRLVAKGFTARQIAQELDIAESTVRHHKEEISKTAGLAGVYQLKVFAGSITHLL